VAQDGRSLIKGRYQKQRKKDALVTGKKKGNNCPKGSEKGQRQGKVGGGFPLPTGGERVKLQVGSKTVQSS